jgi:hypothetical protein
VSSASPALLLPSSSHGPVLGPARHLGDAVADIVHRIEAGHVLFLQIVDRVAFAFGEHGDQHVGAGHFLTAGRLHVNGGALHHPLEAGRRLGIVKPVDHQVRQLVVEIAFQVIRQLVDIDAAGLEHGDGVLVFGQRHQQMFERRVFMVAVVRLRQSAVEAFFEVA